MEKRDNEKNTRDPVQWALVNLFDSLEDGKKNNINNMSRILTVRNKWISKMKKRKEAMH